MSVRRSLAILIGTLMAVGVVVALVLASADDAPHASRAGGNQPTRTSVNAVAPSTTIGSWTKAEQSGTAHEMLQEHQRMMERMRVDASPQMIQLMDNDPMWQMLRSGDMIAQMEQHENDISRMLAEPGG